MDPRKRKCQINSNKIIRYIFTSEMLKYEKIYIVESMKYKLLSEHNSYEPFIMYPQNKEKHLFIALKP